MGRHLNLNMLLDQAVDEIASRVTAALLRARPATLPTADSSAAVPPELLTTAAAGAMIGVAEQTMRNWRSAGTGPPAVQRGSMIRYRPEDVRAWARREFAPATAGSQAPRDGE